MNIYICHHGCNWEGGASEGHFLSEESAISFVEKKVKEMDAERLEDLRIMRLDDPDWRHSADPYKKEENTGYLHAWNNGVSHWGILKIGVLP